MLVSQFPVEIRSHLEELERLETTNINENNLQNQENSIASLSFKIAVSTLRSQVKELKSLYNLQNEAIQQTEQEISEQKNGGVDNEDIALYEKRKIEYEKENEILENKLLQITENVNEKSKIFETVNTNSQQKKQKKITQEKLKTQKENEGKLSPKVFFDIVKKMQKGDNLNVIIKDKTQNVTIELSSDGKIINILSAPKKVLQTIQVSHIISVSFPSHSLNQKGLQTGVKEETTFSIETNDNILNVVGCSDQQIDLWVVGLTNIAFCSKEKEITRGDLLWKRAEMKLKTDSVTKGSNSIQMLTNILTNV